MGILQRTTYMRVVTIIGVAAALALGVSANAATRTATANVRIAIIAPLSITKTNDLAFGNIVPGATAGTVTINQATGAATKTGGVTLFGTANHAASFNITGSGRHNYVITVSAAPTLTRAGGTQTMKMTALRLNGATTRTMAASGTATLTLGGTLAVAANQVAGTYSGTFTVSVAYP